MVCSCLAGLLSRGRALENEQENVSNHITGAETAPSAAVNGEVTPLTKVSSDNDGGEVCDKGRGGPLQAEEERNQETFQKENSVSNDELQQGVPTCFLASLKL